MTVLKIEHGSADYDAAVSLRRRVLRAPLGLDFSAGELAAEANQLHLGLWDEDELVGCLSLVRMEKEFKMRQVAVSPERQRQGIGKRLVEAAEVAVATGLITLHAREVAIPFYEAMGYEKVGDPFSEVGIPHIKMAKRIG